MQIVSIRDNLHEMSYPIFFENKKKIFQNVICRNFYPAFYALFTAVGIIDY